MHAKGHAVYYRELTISAAGFVSPDIQKSLRKRRILVAGAGSIGNPIATMLVRSGAEHVTVLDPDTVEVSNLSRQQYRKDQVGLNKAQATAENLCAINPYVEDTVRYDASGLTPENAARYIKDANIVIDAIDIHALDMIYRLHVLAKKYRKPVIVGYDLAGTAILVVYRYDTEEILPLRGELDDAKIAIFREVKKAHDDGMVTDAEFIQYIQGTFVGPIPPLAVPVEQLGDLANRKSDDSRTYQLGTTSTVLSGLCVETICRIIAGEHVKQVIHVDIPSLVRSKNPSILIRLPLLVRVLLVLRVRRQETRRLIGERLTHRPLTNEPS
jgi:molybdopterin/thiamine biosynthesis adenylyltransferase